MKNNNRQPDEKFYDLLMSDAVLKGVGIVILLVLLPHFINHAATTVRAVNNLKSALNGM